MLHRGDPELTAITADAVEEMRQAIKHIAQVPGIEQVIDPARLPVIRTACGTNAYRAGLARPDAAASRVRASVTQRGRGP